MHPRPVGSALEVMTRPKSGRRLPHSTTQARWVRGSWSRYMRESERRLSMNRGMRSAERGTLSVRRKALRLDPPGSLKRIANVRRETRRTAPETGALPGNIGRRARSDAPYHRSGVQGANDSGSCAGVKLPQALADGRRITRRKFAPPAAATRARRGASAQIPARRSL